MVARTDNAYTAQTPQAEPAPEALLFDQTVNTEVAQAVSPGMPEGTSWTGRPPQRQEDLNFKFFDERTGQTVTVTQPLWKDDNWNLGGYFTVDTQGNRHNIDAWSPAAAHGQNARQVVLKLVNEGLIDLRNVSIVQTHRQMFGGDGGVYWIPTARQTREDGTALFHAQRAAQIPTDSARTIQPNDNPEFARGYRDAELGDRVLAGYALFQTSLAIAGTVVAPINTARIQGRGNFEVVNPNTGQRLRVSSDPRTGGVQGTLYDRNGVPLASQTTVGRDFNRTVTVTPNGGNVTPNVNPGALVRTTPQSTVAPRAVAPGAVVAERPLTVAGTPITIRSETVGGTPNFTAIYGGRQVPLPGATSFEQASQQVTTLASQGNLPGIRTSGPVITDSTLSLSSGGQNYQFTIRNTQNNGQSAYTVHYRIGGQDQTFQLDGARNLSEASQQVTSAFNNGALPGIVSGGPTVTDSPLTLSRGGQNFGVTIRNTQDNGQSLYTARYRIGRQDHEYSLPGARNLTEASQQVTNALNTGALPGISSYTQSPLTLTADGKSYRVTIENIQIGKQPNYSVSYRIGGEDHAFTLPGARNLSEASQQVTSAFNNGNLPGLTRPQPQQTAPAPQETGSVGAMSANDTPQPSLTPEEIASASDLTQRFPSLSEARDYAETRPETEIFKYTDHPGSPEGDDTVYFRGGQEAAPITPSSDQTPDVETPPANIIEPTPNIPLNSNYSFLPDYQVPEPIFPNLDFSQLFQPQAPGALGFPIGGNLQFRDPISGQRFEIAGDNIIARSLPPDITKYYGQIYSGGDVGGIFTNPTANPTDIPIETVERPRISISLGNVATISIWRQQGSGEELRNDITRILRELRQELGGNALNDPNILNRIDSVLRRFLPPSVGYSIAAGGAAGALLNPENWMDPTSAPRISAGEYLEFGNIDALLDNGSVLYNPATKLYSLNVYQNVEGNFVLKVPLEYTLGGRYRTQIPVAPGMSVRAIETTETRRTLTGEINRDLLIAINRGLNDPRNLQIWYDANNPGDSRQVRQINFASRISSRLRLSGNPFNAYQLPQGWTTLQQNLPATLARGGQLVTSEVNGPYTTLFRTWDTSVLPSIPSGIPLVGGFGVRAGNQTVTRYNLDLENMLRGSDLPPPAAIGDVPPAATPRQDVALLATPIAALPSSPEGVYIVTTITSGELRLRYVQGSQFDTIREGLGANEALVILADGTHVKVPKVVARVIASGEILNVSDLATINAFIRGDNPGRNAGLDVIYQVGNEYLPGDDISFETQQRLLNVLLERYGQPRLP
jgi:hypothetical protein